MSKPAWYTNYAAKPAWADSYAEDKAYRMLANMDYQVSILTAVSDKLEDAYDEIHPQPSSSGGNQ